MENLYSVAQFFPDGRWEYVRRHVTAEEAIEAFKHYTTSVGVQMGFVERVIITDAGDCTNVEWIHGKGITFPTQEDMAEAEKEQE